MNGRLYDPILGRFISADPFIQDPTTLQSLNRYSYVWNNPLSMTDPSGFFSLSKAWKKLRDPILDVATGGMYSAHKKALKEFGRFARKNKFVAEVTTIAGCAAVTAAGQPYMCAGIQAGVTYGVTDGDMNATMRTAAIAYVQIGVSQYLSGVTSADQAAGLMGHGLLGGAVSVAQGGKFGHGFASGFYGKAITLGLQNSGAALYSRVGDAFKNTDIGSVAARTAIAAIVGGTMSQAMGGTFANGAVTAAMQHLFNAERETFRQMGITAREYVARHSARLEAELGAIQKRTSLMDEIISPSSTAGVAQALLPASTASFSVTPLGGDQIGYANSINMIRGTVGGAGALLYGGAAVLTVAPLAQPLLYSRGAHAAHDFVTSAVTSNGAPPAISRAGVVGFQFGYWILDPGSLLK